MNISAVGIDASNGGITMIQRGTFANRFIAALVVLFTAPAPEQVLAELPKVETAQAILEPTTFDTLKSLISVDKLRYLVEGSSFFIEADKQVDKQGLWMPPATRTVDYPMEGVSLGQGWDSLRETKTPSECIIFSSEESGGQRARIETRRVVDRDSLRKAMEISTSIAAKAKFKIGGGGGSSKYDFVSSSEVSNHYLNLLVKGSVTNGVTFVSPTKTTNGFIELTQQASDLLGGIKRDEDKHNKFLRYCGDSFVAAIERGAELYALYQFSETKLKDQQRKSRHLSANADYMAFSGSASTSTKKTLETVQQMQVSGLKYMHSAHRGLRLPYNEETINTALASLGSAPEAVDAQPYRIVLVRYDSLPGWTRGTLRSGPATRDALVALQLRLGDLESTVVDMQRNPKNYILSHGPDFEALGELPQVIRSNLSRINTLLGDCEWAKEATTTESQKDQVIRGCAPREDDAGLSDYPIRMLMPIPANRFMKSVTAADVQTRQNAINTLRSEFNSARPRIRFGHRLTCPIASRLEPCAGMLLRITQLENELKLFKDNNEYLDVAESRYRYWIEEIADAREEDGALGGSLSVSEKAMFRREIYCQYRKSADIAECPKPSLTDLVSKGNLIKRVKEEAYDIKGKQHNKPEDAWAIVEQEIIKVIAKLAKSAPHSYEILEQDVESVGDIDGPISFQVKGRVRITYYENDEPETKRLFLSPR